MKTNRHFSLMAVTLLTLFGIELPGRMVEPPTPEARAAKNLLTGNPRLQALIAEANRSSGPEEIAHLTEAGVSATVIQTYAESSGRRYDLDADQIIQLQKRGVSSGVIIAMLRSKANVQSQPAIVPAAPVQPIIIKSEVRESQPASTVTYIRSQPRVYSGPYRYYNRPIYVSAYPYSGWSPGCGYSYGYYCPTAWNYRPAWSYDFRFRGCW